MRRQRGFTLIELLVVMAIIAIMSALIVTVVNAPGNPMNASIDVVSQMQFARHRAIASRRVHRVQFEPNLVSIWQSDKTGYQAPTGYEMIQTVRMPVGVQVWHVANPIVTLVGQNPAQETGIMGTIDFLPDGSCNSGTVYLNDLQAQNRFQVLAYPTTGASYMREGW
jgi:prepilin-type N-terminal cleavage/methylation domain-containing protein